VVLPSVTQIISAVVPRKDGAPPDAIETARLRGTWVDEQFAHWLDGNDIQVGEGVDQSWVDCLGLAIRWWESERLGVKVKAQVRLFGAFECGTADLITEEGEIIDLKATYQLSPKTMAPQLGAYSTLYDEEPLYLFSGDQIPVTRLAVLHVAKRFKAAQFKSYDYQESRATWRLLRDYWRYIQ
jgi:hypothetical protein